MLRAEASTLGASVIVAVFALGCKASIPSGVFGCDRDNDCPTGLVCRREGSDSKKYCFDTGESDPKLDDDGGSDRGGGGGGDDGGGGSGGTGGAGGMDAGMDAGDDAGADGGGDADIDECATNNGGCEPGYACVDNTDAPATCEDIDECQTDNGGCDLKDPLVLVGSCHA